MPENKKSLITIIILVIITVSLLTMALDFSRLLGDSTIYNKYPNDIIKRINVLLAAAIVWLAGNDKLSSKDNRQMKLVFLVVFAGEICFLLSKPDFAIAFFAICQILLIIRHTRGLIAKLSVSSVEQRLMLAFTGFILLSLPLFVAINLRPIKLSIGLTTISSIYSFLISLSLWAGLANYILRLLPRKNSIMVAIGMLCFYCCDILVGLDGLLNAGTVWLLANSLIWFFYAPALTLLALSCYRYSSLSLINQLRTPMV